MKLQNTNAYEVQCPNCHSSVTQTLIKDTTSRYQWICSNCGIVNSAKWVKIKEGD